jgi:hypothetical protein
MLKMKGDDNPERSGSYIEEKKVGEDNCGKLRLEIHRWHVSLPW